MVKIIGKNTNTNEDAAVSTFSVNSVTPTLIAASNPDRIAISVCLSPGNQDTDVFIRLYPASVDAIKQGEVLTRKTLANDNLFRSSWSMKEGSVYTGEISAITNIGTTDIHVTEY